MHAESSAARLTQAQVWLKAQLGEVRCLLIVAQFGSLSGTALACGQAVLLAEALQLAIFSRAGLAALCSPLAWLLALALLRAILAYGARQLQQRAAGQVVTRVRGTLLAQLQARGPVWLTQRDSGELTTRLVDGVESLRPYVARYWPQIWLAVTAPLLILVTVLVADWVAALALAVSLPLIPLFMLLSGRAAAEASRRRWQVLTRLGSQFMDVLQGLTCLRSFDVGKRTAARLNAAAEAYRRETMGVLRLAFLSSAVLEFFAALGVALVAVWVGFRLYWGSQSFAHGMLALLLAPECYMPLRALGALRHIRMDALTIAEDVVELSDAEQSAGPVDAAPCLIAKLAPDICFAEVQLRHCEARGGLETVTLSLAAGTHTALVGESGAGKSSILAALLGFERPTQGQIQVNGLNLATCNGDAWRQQLSWLPQRPYLFAGSFRENLRVARPEASEAELAEAAQRAMLEPILAHLPQGWDTLLGEQGQALSGGEAQRLALARVFLRDAVLLLLDEPCQQLDPKLAMELDGRLREFMRGRTVISAMHRLWQADTADQVAVIAHGRVLECGAPSELRGRGGAYTQLWAREQAA